MAHSYSCERFSAWNNVDEYLKNLEDDSYTAKFETIVQTCNYTICPTVFGSGNADICGIGLLAGYWVETILAVNFGFLLCVYVKPFSSTTVGSYENKRTRKRNKAILAVVNVFFDTSFLFSGSIIVVSLIFGIRKDTNVGTSGLGAIDFEIAASVGLCTFLPLLYPFVFLPVPDIIDSTLTWRVGKMLVCATLYFYIFVTRFIYAFRKRENTTVLDDSQINKLYEVCFPPSSISNVERRVMDAFGLLGSLVLFIIIISSVAYVFQADPLELEQGLKKGRCRNWVKKISNSHRSVSNTIIFYLIMFVLLPFLCLGQLWTVMRLRAQQLAITTHTRANKSQLGDWGFGQVIAIFMWVPVLLELSKLLHVTRKTQLREEMPSLPGPPNKKVTEEPKLTAPVDIETQFRGAI